MRMDRETVAVLTGAGSGIGRALAIELAARCGGLALADVDREGLAETCAQLGATSSCRVSEHLVDVADRAAMTQFRDEVLATHGAVHLLVNNAGVALIGTVEEVSLEDLDWLLGINLHGVLHGVKLFLPTLLQQDRSHIVNISSVFGIIAPPGQAAYAASKFAVRGFTEALRHELSGSRVGVSVVHPGGIRTEIAPARGPIRRSPRRRETTSTGWHGRGPRRRQPRSCGGSSGMRRGSSSGRTLG